jgi:3-methylcrotonyl-CoA carboxylase alpha subunit
LTRYELESDDGPFVADVVATGDGFRVVVSGKEYLLRLKPQPGQNTIIVEFGDKPVSVTILEANPQQVQLTVDNERLSYRRRMAIIAAQAPKTEVATAQTDLIIAPMPGKVIATLVKSGEKVSAGDPLIVLESMKMEVAVRADRDSEVKEILVSEGTAVKRGHPLVRLG